MGLKNVKLSRRIKYFLLGTILSCGLNFVGAHITIDRVVAHNHAAPIAIAQNHEAATLDKLAKQAYLSADYQQAYQFWQQALALYQEDRDIVGVAKVLSSIALTNHQLGNSTQAQLKITQSRKLLEANSTNADVDNALAQVLNNQGIIELALGNLESAIASWEKAIAIYQKSHNQLGVTRAQLNQAQGFASAGLYQRSLDSFTALSPGLASYPNSAIKSAGLRSYGDILRLVGNISQSELMLENSLAIANQLFLPAEQIKSLLSLGKTLVIKGDTTDRAAYKQASEYYQQGVNLCQSVASCPSSNLSLKINLANLNLLVKTASWEQETDLITAIQQQLTRLQPYQDNLDLKLNFINTLITLRQQINESYDILSQLPDWQQITALIDSTIADAQKINYATAEAYSWLLKGHVLENLAQWDRAKTATTKALVIAQTRNAAEISYLCEWQLGRINRAMGDQESAIANYNHGVTLLNTLSNDIAKVDTSVKNNFHNTIEPIYREQIALLLDASADKTISQKNLVQARDTIESLQIAELNNFFQEACLQGKFVSIDSVDDRAAALYPIILPDRLEIILSLPHQPLQHYSVPVSQATLEATIAQLRQTIVIRSRRTFYEPATQLYSWLIEPVIEQLTQQQIKTLVMIPDGALRNIPIAALYDGNHYLIEQYDLVLNPGLQLLDPRPLKDEQIQALAVGLTQQREDFAALDYVGQELAQIKSQVKSSVLIDEEFTTEAFQEKITYSDYPIVHIATHGQFSSSLENTFLLAWNDRINLNQLHQILQVRRQKPEKAIELLVLSACETASGDDEAALGLAGMAIRAGAKSTIATLWSINDQATAELMNILYQKLTDQSLSKAAAIRQAQLSLLQNPQYDHPFYWAAYTIIGNWL